MTDRPASNRPANETRTGGPATVGTKPGDVQPADVRPADAAIGIDFGGSGIKGAVVDVRTGQLVGNRLRIPTPQPSVPREVVAVMDELVQRLVAPWDPRHADAFPVGVGLPSAIRNGVTLTAANIDPAWIGFSAERELGLAMGRTVAAGNDADVAGLAEIRFGAGRRQPGLVFVLTIGTGIGSALFIDGRLVPNTELGHLQLKGHDAEEQAAESARERLGLGWAAWAAGLDDYLHELERLFWPDLFILGGGASKRADNYLPFLTVKTPIALATFRNNAGIVGAALVAHERRSRAAVAAAGEPIV
ncbi:MAG: polyphosphate--glucose phosphotransferase [Candidatus Limnocylindrales bacterium]|jgi:polyphosphate glucokinase